MKKRMVALILLGSLLGSFLLSAGFATAGDLTRGDVEAAFRARSRGGSAALHNGEVTFAAVVEGATDGRINSFLFDGKTYCANDWLVIYNGWGSLGLKYKEAADQLSQIENSFFLDGAVDPLETIRTPVARILLQFVGDFPDPQFGFHEGHILAPGDLARGPHSLRTVVTFDNAVIFDIVSGFTIAECSG